MVWGESETYIDMKNVRIRELQAQLAERDRTIAGFSKRLCLNHCATMSGDRMLRDDGKCEMCALQEQLKALEWTPITAENLPKVGDENGGWFGVFKPVWEVRPFQWPLPSSAALKSEIICESLKVAGWTHFRPINPPAKEAK